MNDPTDKNGYLLLDPSPLPTTRKVAQAAHSLHYATGEPCLRGHISARYTPSGACIVCQRERSRGGRPPRSETPRQLAWLVSAPHYVGKRCPRGHDGTRYTSSGACVTCTKGRAAVSHSVGAKTETREQFFTRLAQT